jgi:uncharacterized protein YihD (DUF1040 family)
MMRKQASPEEIDQVIELLRKAWKRYPEQRLGQIMINVCTQMYGTPEPLWNLDEYELIISLEDLLKHGW